MRQAGAAGLGLSPPRFKILLTIFLDFAGLFWATVSLLRHLRAIRRGWPMAARGHRDAIGQFPYGSDPVTAWARGDGWRLRSAGMGARIPTTN